MSETEPWRLVQLPEWLQEVEEAIDGSTPDRLSQVEKASLFDEHAADMVLKIRQLMADKQEAAEELVAKEAEIQRLWARVKAAEARGIAAAG